VNYLRYGTLTSYVDQKAHKPKANPLVDSTIVSFHGGLITSSNLELTKQADLRKNENGLLMTETSIKSA